MKRSKEKVKDQVKKAKPQVEESSEFAPEFNPFLVEPVLVKLLRLVDKVSQLKELRLMCQTWDEFSLKELEDRGFNGKIKPIDFYWSHQTKSEAETNLVQFLGDTQTIPRLFSSFKFNFPESWVIFSNHMEFFSLYPVTFVYLGIPSHLTNHEQTRGLLVKFLESKIWGNIKEITVSIIGVRCADREYGFPESSLFTPSSGNIDWKLQKLDIKEHLPSILRIFETALASGKFTNLTAIGFHNFERRQLDFPGIVASKLTRLEIGEYWRTSGPCLEYTLGLKNLARDGMKLKSLRMNLNLTPGRNLDLSSDEFFFENLRMICSNLNEFLPNQSCTLENLLFKFICFMRNPREDVPENPAIWCKIHLPQFEVLHSLKLEVIFKIFASTPRNIHTKIFGMTHNLNMHFPKLIKLTLEDYTTLDALRVNPALDEFDKLQLEYLELPCNINHPVDWKTSYEDVIGSVGELHCQAKLLFEERLPWAESLRHLHIFLRDMYGIRKGSIYKLNHLKKLDKLFAKYYGIMEGRIRIHKDVEFLRKPLYLEIEDYLNSFKEATELPLTSIIFIGPGNGVEEIKEKFIKFFPFPVEFKRP